MRESIVPSRYHSKSCGLDAQAMLPSMVMAWTKEIKPVPRMAWTRYQCPVPIAKCIHFWDHTAWISPFRLSLSLISRAIDQFSSSGAVVGIPFLLRTLLPMGYGMRLALHVAAGTFCRNQADFASALWLDVLDISRYAFPLSCHLYKLSFPSFFTWK